MSYRPKKAVIDGIRTRIRTRRDGQTVTVYDAYLGYDPFSRRQKRMASTDLADLKRQIADFYAKLKFGGEASVRLNAGEAQDAREALDMLAQKEACVSLAEAVRRFLGGSFAVSATANDKTLGDAYDGFMASLVGRSPDYVNTLRKRIGRFVCEFGRDTRLSSITAQEVVKGLKDRLLDKDNEKTWKTYNNHLGDLKTFFGWCAKSEQGFIKTSPIADVKKMVLRYHDPEYVKAEDIGRLFAALVAHRERSPADLADAVLSFFCGMRQCEIDRVREGSDAVEINLGEGFVIVKKGKGYTRGVRKRSFTLSEQAKAWMGSFDFMAAVAVSNRQFRRHLVERAKEAGVRLPKNAGRHTFITMYAAAYHDQSKLTSIVGNTEGVRANSYDGVEIEANGRAYFAITPEAVMRRG